MKIQFKKDKRGKILMSNTFNCDYNPYRVGDIININGIICNKRVNKNKDAVTRQSIISTILSIISGILWALFMYCWN